MALSDIKIESLPSSPGPEKSWAGVNMLQGGKGYAPTPLGQVHYRDIGPRDGRATILLMHQSPLSMVEFGFVQNSLAKIGIRSISVDTPGYGMSDQPSILPTVGGLADNFVYVLDHLKIDKFLAGGHHTGASIAVGMADRHPDRVSGVVLHGTPLYSDEELASRKAQPEWDRAPKADGAHLSQLFQRPLKRRDEYEMAAWTWMSVTMFLQGRDLGHWAVHRFDMKTALAALKCPGLIITEGEDVIHHMDVRAHELRPDFMYRVLAEESFTGTLSNPDGWAKIAAEFIDTMVLK